MGGTPEGHRDSPNGLSEFGEAPFFPPEAQFSSNTPPSQISADDSRPNMNKGKGRDCRSDEIQSPDLDMHQGDAFDEALPPPLPPRPQISQERPTTSSTSIYRPVSSGLGLQSKATTALSLTDIHT